MSSKKLAKAFPAIQITHFVLCRAPLHTSNRGKSTWKANLTTFRIVRVAFVNVLQPLFRLHWAQLLHHITSAHTMWLLGGRQWSKTFVFIYTHSRKEPVPPTKYENIRRHTSSYHKAFKIIPVESINTNFINEVRLYSTKSAQWKETLSTGRLIHAAREHHISLQNKWNLASLKGPFAHVAKITWGQHSPHLYGNKYQTAHKSHVTTSSEKTQTFPSAQAQVLVT